jgi:hypothetical protein
MSGPVCNIQVTCGIHDHSDRIVVCCACANTVNGSSGTGARHRCHCCRREFNSTDSIESGVCYVQNIVHVIDCIEPAGFTKNGLCSNAVRENGRCSVPRKSSHNTVRIGCSYETRLVSKVEKGGGRMPSQPRHLQVRGRRTTGYNTDIGCHLSTRSNFANGTIAVICHVQVVPRVNRDGGGLVKPRCSSYAVYKPACQSSQWSNTIRDQPGRRHLSNPMRGLI